MKKLLILSALIPLTGFAQFKYRVHVNVQNADKSTVNYIENDLNTYDRSIEGSVISFNSAVNYSANHIDSVFNIYNVPTLLISKAKEYEEQFVPKAGNNCEQAEILCNNANITNNSSGFGAQELNNSNNGCLDGNEHQSSWYYVNIQTGGTLTMLINPNNNSNDYDFAIWGPFNAATAGSNCPPVTNPVRCSFAQVFGNGNTGLINNSSPCDAYEIANCGGCFPNTDCAYGDQFVNQLTVSAGQIYILMVDNWSASNQGFSLSWGGTSALGCTPVVLPVELVSFSGIKGNKLSWQVDSEVNLSHYTVERSIDVLEWEILEEVPSTGSNFYSIGDNKFASAINYYRLSQTDLDGTVVIFNDKLVSIDNRTEGTRVISVTNIMGQIVDEYTKGFVIVTYEDGTSIKEFR